MIAAGTTLDGYRVERLIGRGGMGVVYEAVQTSVRRRVALKVLRPELADDPAFSQRFRREAQLQASLEHPNVLEVYDVGESDEGLYLAMRLVSGRTLVDLLLDGGLDAASTLKLLGQVANALDAAHGAGLVHRDVKPQNVLVDEDDQAYLADFGLTRTGADTTVASSRPMLGSVAYIAPEIVRGEEPTAASDRYSMAATLFHCLTGEVVFPRGSDAAVLFAHATEPPPRVRERRGELPGELDDVMQVALAKRPDVRPATARAIIEAVRKALGPAGGQLGPPPRGTPVAGTPAATPPDTLPLPTAPPRRLPNPLAMAAALIAAVALGAGAAIWLDGDSGTAAPTAEAPVPPVAAGAQPLGSDLSVPEQSLDCRGRAPTAASPACSIVQSELPGATVLVPTDGVIVGWGVRGASGELALDVIRPRGTDTVRISSSQWEVASNEAPAYFETRLPVEAGDQLGVQLGAGATIGARSADGAETQRWRNPFGGAYGSPDLGPGTGFDYELALRADFVPGEQVEKPPFLTGREAAGAPSGQVRATDFLRVDGPRPARLRVELVELKDRVYLDAWDSERRTLRISIPGLRPKGIPVELQAFPFPGEPTGGVGVWWTNPNSGRLIYHDYQIGKGSLEYAQ